jgi:hypothetical protein
VFGLNALGGAVTILMRDGFNFQGVEADTRYGSFGHIQGSIAAGARSGIWGAFIAGEDIKDDGFRDFSQAKIRRMYADLGVKNDGTELHVNFTGADNVVGVTAAAPVELLDLGWSRTFTSPQTTDNKWRWSRPTARSRRRPRSPSPASATTAGSSRSTSTEISPTRFPALRLPIPCAWMTMTLRLWTRMASLYRSLRAR